MLFLKYASEDNGHGAVLAPNALHIVIKYDSIIQKHKIFLFIKAMCHLYPSRFPKGRGVRRISGNLCFQSPNKYGKGQEVSGKLLL